ncbi:MAG: phosphoadenosine phosphosulfate reductase family protein [Bacilli bacterium]|nr:phosphoadenosine phosphosulfate reductase family protein [Bacilli bacterium]
MSTGVVKQNYYIAKLSGGKDSLYMFAHIMNNLDRYPLDAVAHVELPYDYPWVKNVIDYMENKCKILGIPFYRLKPEITFEEGFEKWGYPTRLCKWCNRAFKLDTVNKFERTILKDKNCISYIGFCADEVKRFKNSDNEIYPLAELGIYEETIWRWAKNQDIFNDHYRYTYRQDCMYCPMRSKAEDIYLYHYYPEYFDYFNKLAMESEKIISDRIGHKFTPWGAPKYDTQYRIDRVKRSELKELTEWKKR